MTFNHGLSCRWPHDTRYSADMGGNIWDNLFDSPASVRWTASHGYAQVGNYLVHRIVADCFLHNPDECSTVDHINHDITNNTIDNLRWATYTENNGHIRAKRRLRERLPKNVYRATKASTLFVQVCRNGVTNYRGPFTSVQAADDEAHRLRALLYNEFAVGGVGALHTDH